MYNPTPFQQHELASLQQLMQAHPLACIVTQAGGLDAEHIPLLLRQDGTPFGCLAGHVARANPLWKLAQQGEEGKEGIACLAIFQAQQAYVSPAWYEEKALSGKVVPTWNYSVLHVHGRLRVREDSAWLLQLLNELSARHESTMPRPWAVSDAPPDYIASLMRAIVGIEIEIQQCIGKYKLSQNKSGRDQARIIEGLRASGAPGAYGVAENMQTAFEKLPK